MTAEQAGSSSRQLVLIPGLNNMGSVFDGVRASLAPSIDLYTPDNPPLATVDAIAHALLATAPPRFWLGGFSFGGYVALAMLALAPERIRGIALICTAPFADTPAQSEKRAQSIATARAGGYLAMIDAQAANAMHPASLENTTLMATRRAMVRAYGAERYIAHVEATIARPDRSALLDGRIPTLIVAASHDKVFTPASIEPWATRIPGARFVQIADAGHLVPMEQPAALAAALNAWIA